MSSEKSQKLQSASEFQKRLVFAFEGRTLREIASILDENYNSVWNWASGRSEMPHRVLAKIANYGVSLNWLLTGEEREAVLRPTMEEFDIEAAIRVNDNPRLVMEQWYDFEGLPVPADFVRTLSLDDWGSRPMDTKVKQIRAMRAIYERNKERQKMYASTKTETT